MRKFLIALGIVLALALPGLAQDAGDAPQAEATQSEATGLRAVLQDYAKQIANLFHDSPRVLEDVVDSLFHIAGADGVMHPEEMRFLERVTEIFGIKHRFRCIRARHMHHPDDAAYEALGVSPCDDLEDIRRAYRKLVRENHPDRLVARGVPKEMLRLATERMAAINAAFETIIKDRGAADKVAEIAS